jgi:microcystin-dependent protein
MKKLLFSLLFVLTVNTMFAQAEAFLGEIRIFAGSYPPRGWMFCEGQTLTVQQYTALYSLLGTTYGGNGQTTFNIPDLRGRVPVGVNQNSSQPYPSIPISQGQVVGNQYNTLTVMNFPYTFLPQTTVPKVSEGEPSQNIMVPMQSTPTPFTVVQPSLGIRYIICVTYGIYPSRD